MVMSTPGEHKAGKGRWNTGWGMEVGGQRRLHMKMTLEQKPEERGGGGPVDTWVKSVPDRGTARAKAMRQHEL